MLLLERLLLLMEGLLLLLLLERLLLLLLLEWLLLLLLRRLLLVLSISLASSSSLSFRSKRAAGVGLQTK